jgi:predicted acetyltransferase
VTVSLDVRRAEPAQVAIVDHLLEFYCHDLAEYFLLDADEDGRYRYPPVRVWNDTADVLLASLGRIPVGFAIVAPSDPLTGAPGRDLQEFFVVRRHRRAGLGADFANRVWDRYPGEWLVRVFHGNVPALPFWRRVIDLRTQGAGREDVRLLDARTWSWFTFTS